MTIGREPLSMDWKVWRALLVLAGLMLGFAALCLYFSTLFLAFVLGAILIVIFGRPFEEKERVKPFRHLSRFWRRLFRFGTAAFWIVGALLAMGGAFMEMNEVIEKLEPGRFGLSPFLQDKVLPYMSAFFEEGSMLNDKLDQLEGVIFEQLRTIFTWIPSFFLTCALVIPLMFHTFLIRKDATVSQFMGVVPVEFRTSVFLAAVRIGEMLHAYFITTIMRSVVVGVVCLMGFYVSGVPGAFALALLAGALNVIPYIGPMLGGILPMVLSLANDDPTGALLAVVVVVVANIVENFYLVPFVVAKRVQLNSLLTVVLVLSGAQVAGAMGMLFAVPFFLMMKIVLTEAYTSMTLRDSPSI